MNRTTQGTRPSLGPRVTSTSATDVAAVDRMPVRRPDVFYRAMGIVTVVIVIAGFAPRLLFPAQRVAPITPLVSIHGMLFSAWLLLYLLQTHLVATGRRTVHRTVGIVGGPLAITMVVVGYATAIAMARRGYDLSGDLATTDPLGALVFPLGDLVSFSVLIGAGFWWRGRTEVHKRLMLLATVGALMAAPLAHLLAKFPAVRDSPAVIVLLLALLYFSPAIHDRVSKGRVHPVSIWGGAVLLIWANLRAGFIGPSERWHHFAAWLIS